MVHILAVSCWLMRREKQKLTNSLLPMPHLFCDGNSMGKNGGQQPASSYRVRNEALLSGTQNTHSQHAHIVALQCSLGVAFGAA